jgi:small subunit ribosomal protein S6
VRQEASQQDAEKLAETFTAVLAELGGKVVKKEYWGLRALAYKIQKNRKGHYIYMCLDAPAAAIKELDRKYRLNEDVIRFLTIRVEEISKGPSVVLKQQQHAA